MIALGNGQVCPTANLPFLRSGHLCPSPGDHDANFRSVYRDTAGNYILLYDHDDPGGITNGVFKLYSSGSIAWISMV